MIPNNTVMRSNVRDPYQFYDNALYEPLNARVRGGLDIRDPVLGLDVSDWLLWYDLETRTFNLDKDNKLVRTLGTPPYGRVPTEIAVAFDEEMRFYWAYSYLDTEGEFTEKRIEFNWYHPDLNQTVKLILDDVYSVKLLLDDRRLSHTLESDICLIYVRNSDRVVCVRYQRDLFQVEYPLFLLRTGESLVRVDITTANQLQFEIGRLQKPYTWVKLLDTEGFPVYNHKGHPIWVVENYMSEAVSLRPALEDLSYQREINGGEFILIVDKSEEKELSLTLLQSYIVGNLNINNYVLKTEADSLYTFKTDTYTRSELHDLFEVKGSGYSRLESDSKYALRSNSYTKGDIDVTFARKEEVYTRKYSDESFALKSDTLTTVEADNRYLQLTQYDPTKTDLTVYLTKEDAAFIYARQDDVITPSYLQENYVPTSVLLNGYYTKDDVKNLLAEKDIKFEPLKDNLIANGVCEYQDRTGWSLDFTYVGNLSPVTPYGAMKYAGACKRIPLAQKIPLLLNTEYDFEVGYRYINKVTPGVGLKVSFLCLDRDKNIIAGYMHSFEKMSMTKLVAPLKIGDTSMRVQSTDGWLSQNPGVAGFGNIMFFNYKDNGGYVYANPNIPYTRNIAIGEHIPFKENENAIANAHINKSTGSVGFSSPWSYRNPNTPDGSFPAGTIIARSRPYSGGDEFEFRCLSAVDTQFDSPDTNLFDLSKTFKFGFNNTGRYTDLTFPPGTAYIQPIIYPNYNYWLDKTEYGFDASVAPNATDDDIIAIHKLYLRNRKV